MVDGWRLTALVRDSRLTREARIMGAHLIALGAGKHEVSTEDWQRLLGPSRGGPPKRQSLSGWAAELELHGYARKVPGGVGSPRYEVVPQEDGRGSTVLQEDGRAEIPTVPLGDGSRSTVPQEDTLPSPRRTVEASPTPPPYPTPTPPPPLAASVEAALEVQAEHLNGCRGSLRDYLVDRVSPENRHGYAMTVSGWIQGTNEAVWADGRGEHLHDGRSAVLADALNQLRSGDEVGPHFPGPPGDIRNLQKKVRYLVRGILGSRRDATRSAEKESHADHAGGSPGTLRGGPRPGPRPQGRYAGAAHRRGLHE